MSRKIWHKVITGIVVGVVMIAVAACNDSDGEATTQTAEPTPIVWQAIGGEISQNNAPNVRLTGRFDGHSSTVFQMMFSPDSRYLGTISAADRRVSVWDMASGGTASNVGLLQPSWVFFDPSAEYFYIIDRDQNISQWSVATGNNVEVDVSTATSLDDDAIEDDETTGPTINSAIDSLRAQPDSSLIGSITFGQGGNWVATAGERGQVYVISLDPFAIVAQIDAHPIVPVFSIAMTNDGPPILATLGSEELVRVWDIETNTMLQEFGNLNDPRQVLFAPDDTQLAILTPSVIQLYSTTDWSSIATIVVADDAIGNSAHFSADGTKIVTYGAGTSVYVWDIASQNLWVELPNHQRGVKEAQLSHDNSLMLTVSIAGDIFLWDLTTVDEATSEAIDLRRAALPIPNNVEIHDVLWSPDERVIAVADYVGRILILSASE